MIGRTLSLRAVTPDESRAWRDLAARAVEANPLFEPECLVPAAAFQSFGDELQLVVAEDEGRFYGCVPIRHVKRFRMLVYPVVTSQVRRMHYLGTPLVDPDRGMTAASAILQELERECRRRGSRVFFLPEVTHEGPVDSYFRQAARANRMPVRRFDVFVRGAIDRSRGVGPQEHGAMTLRTIRKKRNRLSRALGAEVQMVDRGQELEAIDDYLALEASGYKAEHGVAMTTVPGEPEYFRAMCEGFAKDGRLHLMSLVAGDTTVAMVVWIRGGPDMFLIKSSYDDSYSQFSPGAQLHMESIRYFYESTDANVLDTCTFPENELLLRTYPDRRILSSSCIFLRRSWIDRAIIEAFLRLRPLHAKLYRRLHSRTASRGKLAPGMVSSPPS